MGMWECWDVGMGGLEEAGREESGMGGLEEAGREGGGEYKGGGEEVANLGEGCCGEGREVQGMENGRVKVGIVVDWSGEGGAGEGLKLW